MFLLKLRTFVAVAVVAFVGAGVVGLSYQTGVAQSSKPAGTPAGGAAQAAADDLDALRLEVEALRKELRATRERVKTLEDQVASLTGTKAGSGSAAERADAAKLKDWLKLQRFTMEAAQRDMREAGLLDSLAEAEAALKKLKERPDDKQAADALEKAVQRLKERAKPDSVPGQPQSR